MTHYIQVRCVSQACTECVLLQQPSSDTKAWAKAYQKDGFAKGGRDFTSQPVHNAKRNRLDTERAVKLVRAHYNLCLRGRRRDAEAEAEAEPEVVNHYQTVSFVYVNGYEDAANGIVNGYQVPADGIAKGYQAQWS